MGRRFYVTLIAVPILVSGTAAMADNKSFPGAMCQPTLSTDPFSRDRDLGSMVNTSGSNEVWICPFVHDAETGNGINSAAVTVLGTDVNAFTCAFHSMNVDGSQADTPRPASSITQDNFNATLHYTRMLNAADGYYYFECNVNANSGVLTYTVNEAGRTN